MWINLPNLDELSFFAVFALPKASNKGLEAKTYYSIETTFETVLNNPLSDSLATYFNIIFVDSVFPEPLSPEIIIEQILFYLAVYSNSSSKDI